MTKVQACAETPESNAMTESPAMSSQKNNEASASNCEMINQMTTGRRAEGATAVSKGILQACCRFKYVFE